MQIVSLNPVLLRAALPDLLLRPGLSLFGHVAERHGEHGLLMLAGTPVVAHLPPEVDAGARLRLRVTEATLDRITLAIMPDAPSEAPPPQAAPAHPPVAFALPGGSQVQLQVHPDGEAAGGGPAAGGTSVTLRLDSPELGRMTLRLDTRSCAVHVTAGEPHRIVQEAAGELGRALADVTGHPLLVTVHPVEANVDFRA